MQQEHDVVIDADGTVRFIYSDDVAEVFADELDQRTVRASHVEPHVGGGWCADMRPSGGGLLFPGIEQPAAAPTALIEAMRGFSTRQQALDAEVAWLRQHKGL